MNVHLANLEIIAQGKLPLNVQFPVDIEVKKTIEKLKLPPFTKKKEGKVVFLEGTSNQAIHYFHNIKLKCAVVNFGNSRIVGGGNLGYYTQEEELCKTIPELYPSRGKQTQKRHNEIIMKVIATSTKMSKNSYYNYYKHKYYHFIHYYILI